MRDAKINSKSFAVSHRLGMRMHHRNMLEVHNDLIVKICNIRMATVKPFGITRFLHVMVYLLSPSS